MWRGVVFLKKTKAKTKTTAQLLNAACCRKDVVHLTGIWRLGNLSFEGLLHSTLPFQYKQLKVMRDEVEIYLLSHRRPVIVEHTLCRIMQKNKQKKKQGGRTIKIAFCVFASLRSRVCLLKQCATAIPHVQRDAFLFANAAVTELPNNNNNDNMKVSCRYCPEG